MSSFGISRQALLTANEQADYSLPSLKKQADAVDLVRLEVMIEYIAKRAVVITHAFDVMKSGTHRHPMAAIIHSLECQGEDLDAQEFFQIIKLWAKLCQIDRLIIQG
jgi:hypothetical protein